MNPRPNMVEEDNSKKIAYIIPHTHWDREWYVPFQYFRFRLVEVIDDLLDIMDRQPEFSHFNMDGQTVVLEDYLEIKPENKEKLASLIRQKKIGIGPWYLLSSPWLQTGEGIVRNLLRGISICDEFDVEPVDVAWTPDQYIHPIQFPQIFQGFGINHAIIGRGMGNQYDENPNLTNEFYWEGQDGSKLLTFFLPEGYGTNAHLGTDPMQAINQIAVSQSGLLNSRWSTDMILSFAGSDHCGPEEVLLEAIEIWNEEEELIEELGRIKLSSWEEYLRDFHDIKPKLETLKCEFSGRRYSISLHGVFSSYMNLKQRSFHIHNLLEKYTEPFGVFSSISGLEYKHGAIDTAWKWLLRNQPHDSSWTSSVDPVEKEMDVRFDWAEQLAHDSFRRSVQWILQKLSNPDPKKNIPIVIFNPHPWKRTELIIARFDNRLRATSLALIDGDGNEITTQYKPVKSSVIDRNRRRVYVGSHGSLGTNFYEISFVAEDVPPMGYKTYYIKARDPDIPFLPPEEGLLDGNDYYLENDAMRIVVEKNGVLTLMHRVEVEDDTPQEEKIIAMGEELAPGSIWAGDKFDNFTNLHIFEDISDIGDGWEHEPVKNDKPIQFQNQSFTSQLIEASDFRGVIRMDQTLEIPSGASDDGKSRRNDTVKIPVSTTITLSKGDYPVVKFQTKFTNLAENHRLRVLFPTGLKAKTISVNGHFGILDRTIAQPDGSKWVRPPESIYPHHKFVTIWDREKEKGFALLTKGLPEYEAIEDENGEIIIALTLCRCTGFWGGHIGVKPPVPTPNAQLIGLEMTFEYAIVPLDSHWQNSVQDKYPIYRLAEEFYTPLHWEEEYDTYRYRITKDKKTLPDTDGILEIQEKNIILSAIKADRHVNQRNSTSIFRIYNILHEKSFAHLIFNHPVSNIMFCDLKEEPLDPQPPFKFDIKSGELEFEMGPAKIATIKCQLK